MRFFFKKTMGQPFKSCMLYKYMFQHVHLVLIINIYINLQNGEAKKLRLNSQKHMSSQEDAGLL